MKKLVMLMLTSFLLFTAYPAQAYEGEIRTTDNLMKPWSITFNKAVDPETVDSGTIFIKSGNNAILPSSLVISDNGEIIEVKPGKFYKPGLEYSLIILSKLKSQEGKISLSKDTIMKFKYEGKAFTSVNANPLPLGMLVNVKTKPAVRRIVLTDSAGSVHTMHRDDLTDYSHVLLSHHIGDILKIKAYDKNNLLLEDLAYEI